MRRNKRAVCILLAVLLALGCLGMAGCKEPHPEYYFVGRLKIGYMPGNWELTNDIDNKYDGSAAKWFKIDEETNLGIIFKDTLQSLEEYYQNEANAIAPHYKRSEMLGTRTIAEQEAIHYMVYYESNMTREIYALEFKDGIGSFCIERTADSQYVAGEEFDRVLDSAQQLTTISEDLDG